MIAAFYTLFSGIDHGCGFYTRFINTMPEQASPPSDSITVPERPYPDGEKPRHSEYC